MLRTTLTIPLLLAAACAAGSSPAPTPPAGPDRPASPDEQAAATLGISVLSRDAAGAPRLIRAVVPRASAAGMAPEDAAREHVAVLAPLWVKSSPAMPLVTRAVQRLRNGATVVRLAQEIDGAVVHHGDLRVLLNRDGSLVAIAGTLVAPVDKPSFVLSARDAVAHALDAFYGKARPQLALGDGAASGGWQSITVGAHPDLRVTSARARRALADVGGRLGAVWSVEIFGDDKPDPSRDSAVPTFGARRFLVADGDGRIVEEANLVAHEAFVYRAYAETTGNRRPFDNVLESFAPHPTGFPDGSTPEFIGSNLIAMDSFNGPRDPWLPSNATTTSGNNAVAFSDFDATGTITAGDIRPSVRAGRVLNHRFDPTLGPFASEDQLHAATINAFYTTNWMHDWWYDSGFTEATGNAQLNNFGRGGIDGDPIIVRSQNGAATGERNNAFMATPADGASPNMMLLLWTPRRNIAIATPFGALTGFSFGSGPQVFELTGELALAQDAVAPTADGCSPITNNVSGKIALLVYSTLCNSRDMVNNARAAGAIAAIVADHELEVPRLFGGSGTANLPGLTVGKATGEQLLAALENGAFEIALTSGSAGPERDSGFDNTLIAHEWGHYLHHRLADCVGTSACGAMSEGWGDFNALLMMLREGDHREGAYPVSTYSVADGATPNTGYFGIRRYPYSLDRSKNDLSLRHVDDRSALPTHTPRSVNAAGLPNSQAHCSGEVWASMLWESLNVLVDAHGVTIARRRMSDYVVAGLLLTPPNASFTEGRDAILAAVSALDSDDMLLMAAAFAGRGAGSCAFTPPHGTPGNVGVVESGTLAARIEVGGVSLAEDVASCDFDGYLDPGEAGTLRLTLHNSGAIAAEEVSVTATASLAGVRLGAPVRVGLVQPFSSVDLEIPVTMPASAPRNANLTIALSITGERGCERNGVSVDVSRWIGVDEVAGVSRIDHVETAATPWTTTGFNGTWHRETSGGNQLWRGSNPAAFSLYELVSPALLVSQTEPFVVRLSHAWSFEGTPAALIDGGVIELSINGSPLWLDVSAFGVDPGYTGRLPVGVLHPLVGRLAYSATSPGFPARNPLVLDFGRQLAGLSVALRFRIGTDNNNGAHGWDIDDIEVSGTDNTPFPVLVPEPTVCTRRSASHRESRISAITEAPATSLAEYDAEVCRAEQAL